MDSISLHISIDYHYLLQLPLFISFVALHYPISEIQQRHLLFANRTFFGCHTEPGFFFIRLVQIATFYLYSFSNYSFLKFFLAFGLPGTIHIIISRGTLIDKILHYKKAENWKNLMYALKINVYHLSIFHGLSSDTESDFLSVSTLDFSFL